MLLQQVCDQADIDATTGACLHPQWVTLQTMLPPLDAAAGVAISAAILAVWALCWGYKVLRRVGD